MTTAQSDEVRIPYRPRFPQTVIHRELERHRFSVLVAHRRMGKTVLAVNHLLKMACIENKERGFYIYLAPYRNQAKMIAWSYLKHYSAVIPGVVFHEGDLSVSLPNGSTIRLFGADNPDAMRGIYVDGAVIDEVAQMKPEVWGEILRPALADRHGWAVFIGTPKGINLFSQIYDQAVKHVSDGDDEWAAMLYSVDQTGVIPPRELEALRAEMSEAEFRQEFMCDFAAASDDALISIEDVRAAAARTYREDEYAAAPLVFGVDVARFGSDSSVIFRRRGMVAFEPVIYRGIDNMQLADAVARLIAEEKPDAVFIDAGQGQGVIDRLTRGLGLRVTEVPFGGAPLDTQHYANRRIEMWDQMARWIRDGGSIPPSVVLQSDLCAPTYGFTLGKGLKILESKDKIKERIGRSPDLADALALTFAAPVRARNGFADERRRHRVAAYDPLGSFDKAFRH